MSIKYQQTASPKRNRQVYSRRFYSTLYSKLLLLSSIPPLSLFPPSLLPRSFFPSFLLPSSLLPPPSSFLYPPFSLSFPSPPFLLLHFSSPFSCRFYHKQVYYTPRDSSTQPRTVEDYAEGSIYQLDNLRYGTMFSIHVRAMNGAGEGPMSNIATNSTTIGG